MKSFDRAGLTFDVRDHGPAGAEAVVCLHGFPQDPLTFEPIATRLVAAGLRVLVPALRGYSPGARPTGRTAYAMPELVADVLALLDAAELDRAHIVGHDWGGAAAWALAGRHADRVSSVTVMSTPHPAALQAALRRSAQGPRLTYMVLAQLPWLPERLILARDGGWLRKALAKSGVPDETAQRYVRRMLEPGALSGALGWYRGIPMSGGYHLGRITVAASFLWGGRDPVFTRKACELTAKFVRGPYAERALPQVGHWIPETHPNEVSQMVLENVERSRREW